MSSVAGRVCGRRRYKYSWGRHPDPMSRRTGGRFVSGASVIYVVGMVSSQVSWPRV
jgi:hypothetical protein